MLLEIFKRIPDHRSEQSQQFDLAHLLQMTVHGVVSGCHSYRMIHTFIKTHFDTLKNHYGIEWKRAPAYSTIRKIIHGMDEKSLLSRIAHFRRQELYAHPYLVRLSKRQYT